MKKEVQEKVEAAIRETQEEDKEKVPMANVIKLAK